VDLQLAPMSLDDAPEGVLAPAANRLDDVGLLWPTNRWLSIVHVRCSSICLRAGMALL
jgi:hypothetical protein